VGPALNMPVEGKVVQGFEGMDVGNRIRVQLIEIDVEQGFIDFRNVGFSRHRYGETMKREVGLWLDHRKAVIVIVTDEGEETKIIESNMEKHVRYSSDSSEPVRVRTCGTGNL